MLESFTTNKFEYKKLTESEQKARGILGRLVGVIADTKNPTRNGRKYSNQLWENVFNNPIMKEKIENRVCFGELGHPADRTETDMEKIAICLAEQPKRGSDGKIYGVFDILSTPNGRILKELCDYGCNIGISSRGQGDLITDDNGDEAVDPDTYDCECWDAVLVPGVEAARLRYVTESLDTKKTLKIALEESLNSANETDRKIMEETLNNLNIELDEPEKDSIDNNEESTTEEDSTETAIVANDDVVSDLAEVPADDVPAEEQEDSEGEEDEMLDELPAAEDPVAEEPAETEKSDEEIFLDFLANNFDEDKVKKVAKILDIEILDDEGNPIEDSEDENKDEESENEEEINNESTDESDKDSDEDIDDKDESNEDAENDEEAVDEGLETLVSNLKEAIKAKSDLENEVKNLHEKLAASDARVNASEANCNKLKEAVTRLSLVAKSNKDLKDRTSELQEALDAKDQTIKTMNEELDSLKANKENDNKLNESLNNQKTSYEAKINSLNEQLSQASEAKNSEIKTLTEKLDKQSSLKESYKKLANKAVNKYIEVKADVLGLTPADIKRKLGESYTMEDVDAICEDLKKYYFNVSNLPFRADRKIGVRVNESTTNNVAKNKNQTASDDDVDDALIRMAKFGL